MKQIKRTGRERTLSRVVLGVTVAMLAVGLALGGGPQSVLASAFQSPTPSGSTSPSSSPSAKPSTSPSPSPPSGPAIQFYNPAPGYQPVSGPPRPPGVADTPKISDRFDGVDERYHVLVGVVNAPPNAVVELYVARGTPAVETTIGLMDQVVGNPNTYEFFWDIPANFAEGAATMRVRLYEGGTSEVAKDDVAVDIQHLDGGIPPQPADETIELTWPVQNGPVQFYKPRGGTWRGSVEGITSTHTSEVDLFYTTTQPGFGEPVYKLCGNAAQYSKTDFYTIEPIPFAATCTLQGTDTPAQVVAIAGVTLEADKPDRSDANFVRNELTQDAADVHLAQAYVPDPDTMQLKLEPLITGQTPDNNRRVVGGCLGYVATVTDHINRPVQGVNIDVEMVGPNDQVQFGDENSTTTPESDGYQNPDKGGHQSESAHDCDTVANQQGTQGEHNVPGGNDTKHRESTAGTSGSGRWRFHIFSNVAGFTDLSVWIDEEDLGAQSEQRPADSDTLDQGDAFKTMRAQWYSTAPTVDITPAGGVELVGTCARYQVKVRSGTAAVPQANVDFHATGPDNALDFCDPGDGTDLTAPDAGEHDGEDANESSHPGAGIKAQHAEGQSDSAGNLVIGITSPVVGDTTLLAWLDGEPFLNDDVQQTAERSKTVTHTWGATADEAKLSFVNPSAYGPATAASGSGNGTKVSKVNDGNATYHVVVRSDSAVPLAGVELFLVDGATVSPLGDMTKVGTTDTYEFLWGVNVADGDYSLRARIKDTTKVFDQAISVDSVAAGPTDPTDTPGETTEITKPLNTESAGFIKSATPMEGTASAGAEAVELFYTTVAGSTTPASADWKFCGYIGLDGAGTAVQTWKGSCALSGSDQPSQVTGLAAIAFSCSPTDPRGGAGCDANPAGSPPLARNPGTKDSGDAHRVFGIESNPIVTIEPAEAETQIDRCQKFVLTIRDQTQQPIGAANIDLHMTGPSDDSHFCDVEDGTGSNNRAPDQGGHSVDPGHPDEGFHSNDSGPDSKHTEGESNTSGRFVFGVTSGDVGDSLLLAFNDLDDDDDADTNEATDTSVMHWTLPNCTIEGTPGNDNLTGTSGNDRICGKGGADTITGGTGNDRIKGGKGRDEIRGGDGDDELLGGTAADRVFGDAGLDNLLGGKGPDRLNGGADSDSCNGGPGEDTLTSCESGSERRPAKGYM